MTYHFIDGMDNVYNIHTNLLAQKYISSSTFDQQSRISGRYDSASLSDYAGGSMNNAFGFSRLAIPLVAPETYIYMGFDIMPEHGTGGTFTHEGDFLELMADVLGSWMRQTRLAVRSDGRLEIWKGTGSQLVGTLVDQSAAGILVQDSWTRIEVEFGTNTGFRVRANGTVIISQPALNLLNAGAALIERVTRYWSHFGNNRLMWDNLAVWSHSSEAWLGYLQVATYWPYNGAEADVETGAFTPSSGTNLYSRLYERDDFPNIGNTHPNEDTSYVSTSGDTEAWFRFQQPVVFDTILAIAVQIQVKCASGCTVQAIANDQTTSYYSTAQSVSGASYDILQFIFRVRPSDNSAWTTADLLGGAWRFGVKLSSVVGEARVSAISLEVLHARGSGALNKYRAY